MTRSIDILTFVLLGVFTGAWSLIYEKVYEWRRVRAIRREFGLAG